MRTASRLLLIIACLLSVTKHGFADKPSFNRDIRPILSDACFYCHGPDAAHREAGLRLDVEEEAKDYAIVPGDLEASEVVARITAEDPDMRMPPVDSGKELTDEQIELLKTWIEQGAEYEPYWAYVDPAPHPVPDVGDAGWPLDPIDRFVLAKLQTAGLPTAPEADPATLLRRLSFDLEGLPPSAEEVRAFVADPSPAAYAAAVDRKLASPAFAERMAMYWLDLVRYADTVGYHGDQDHNISPYRDYVIDAFNQNMPLDQFTREQLAGDLLPGATTDQLIASGYNRLLQTSHEGGVQPKEYLAIYAADRVRNVSAVWMGATVGCAQCHDHKFDPYTIKDFYSMVAFFADIDEQKHFSLGTNDLPTARPPEIEVLSRWQRERLAELDGKIASLDAENANAEPGDAQNRVARQRALEAERETIKQSARLTMITQAIPPREIRVLPRGNWMDDSGEVVDPAVPEFLGHLDTDDRRANRLDLANWLTDSERGVGYLTARVFVNRLWYLMFGRGLSASLDDFGGQGEPPTHPELLDQLAVDFVRSGWDVKQMVRRLVLSRTYRQSSIASPDALQRDPYNEFFARQTRYRLPAEMVRDNALSVSGLIVRQVGGASVKPYQPAGYYRHLNFPPREYEPHADQRQWRRGVYVHWQRQFLHPMLRALDAPTREECVAQRSRSNTPLEALVLLNDPTMVEAAMALAARVLNDPEATREQRLEKAFLSATSRLPDDFEVSQLDELLDAELAHFRAHSDDADRLIASIPLAERLERDRSLSQSERAELAAWTGVARAILNLYETVTRN